MSVLSELGSSATPPSGVGLATPPQHRDRAALLAAAFKISRQIAGVLDLDKLWNEITAQIQAEFACRYVALLLPEGDILARRAFAGTPEHLPELRVSLSSSSLAAQAYTRAQIALSASSSDLDPLNVPMARVAAIPLLADDQPLGVVELWRANDEPWSDLELEALTDLSHQVALAIVNVRRYAEAQRHTRDLILLDQIHSSLAVQPSLPDLLHELVEQTASVLGYPLVSLYMLRGEWVELFHQVGYTSVGANLSDRRSLTDGVFGKVARTNQPVRLPTTALLRYELAEALGVTSSLSIPIRAGRVICGVLTVESIGARILDEGDQQLLMALADQVAVAMEFSHLYETLESRVTHLALVDDISRTVTANLEHDAALQAIVTQVPRAVPCQRLTLASYNSDDYTFIVRALWLSEGETKLDVGSVASIGDTEAGVALRTGRLHYVPDLAQSQYLLSQMLLAEGLRSAVHVPIMAPEGCLGMLSLSRGEPRAFSAYDRSLLGSIAPHIATAFRNAELYAQAQRAYAELAAAQERNVQTEKLRALGEMASGVAHDFNNVLTIILGHMELIKTPDSPNFERSRRAITQAAQDGAHTVRRIREFVRTQPEQHTTPVDLAELGDDVLHLTRPRWQAGMLKKGITIQARTDLRKVPLVLGSAAELREVMTNLIMNAVDAMPHGGTLSLATGVAGNQVWLEVGDTGQGIPAEVRERIFEPFYTTKAERGTGLGLAVSRSIARRHEGDLIVESAPGMGSRFRLMLPLHAQVELPHEPQAANANVPLEPMRILLVEDDQAVRETLQQLLRLDGHTITAAASGPEALMVFQPDAFDLVCSDLGMPGMNGWELIARLRAQDPDLATLLLSGWGAQIEIEEARAKGVDYVVPKPIDMDALNTALAEAARRKR
jgi:signal transduction histidine kinase/ActR/RegA family two-component response regulator